MSENNVVSIFDAEKKEKDDEDEDEKEEYNFEAIIKKNKKNLEREGRDRNKSNNSVIRGYRLKPKSWEGDVYD